MPKVDKKVQQKISRLTNQPVEPCLNLASYLAVFTLPLFCRYLLSYCPQTLSTQICIVSTCIWKSYYTMTATKPLPIIHLNGFPGTGKLTVAKLLEKLLAPRARLVHNHLLINPAEAVLRRDEVGYQSLRQAIRAAIFSSLVASTATHDFAYLFTDFQSNDEIGSAVCAEHRAAAKDRGCQLISVVLSCDDDTNLARLSTEERRVHGKIVDAALLKRFRQGVVIHRFDQLGEMSFELDVSNLSAEETAQQLLDYIIKVCPELTPGVGQIGKERTTM